jgi:hypothetical protein
MDNLINIKVQRIGDGCYRGFSDEIQELFVEGPTVWETLKAARHAVRKIRCVDKEKQT